MTALKTTDEIRESFLKFFEARGHKILPSDSLVPSHDKSLLFTSAGMNQFKDMFLGSKRLPHTRMATAQKCLRTGDLETVGKTNRHHSFFEMLGNFSFGDYFKKDAIEWAWEYLTKTLSIPESRLYVSVYKDDTESLEIWAKDVHIPRAKIYKFGEADNFWPANAPSEGPDGPCGPCSEIHYDFGHKYGCGKATCEVGCPCGRYTEVWNLVFTQFERRGQNNLVPLKQENIDTGMGLERLAAVIQGKFSNFETDLFEPIIKAARESITRESNLEPDQTSLRKIADHIRALAFAIGDGIIPSNEGRGYVIRRILRQAQRHVYKYDIRKPLLYNLVGAVSGIMKNQYPLLDEKREAIALIVKGEEEKFLNSLESGYPQLESVIKDHKAKKLAAISAKDVFFLHDTYGFPAELTREIAQEHGLDADIKGFNSRLEIRREESRKKSAFSGEIFERGAMQEIKTSIPATKFTGYHESSREAAVVAIIKSGSIAASASKGDRVIVILDTTPFYAEGGGQVGDSGQLISGKGKARVSDTKSADGRYLHYCTVEDGILSTGDTVTASIDTKRRLNIMRNHTGTHLLQAALRWLLGPHIEQTGSIVEEDRLRFDFTHPKPLTPEQIRQVEESVNSEILKDEPVEKLEMSLGEAKKAGALMFFGEKYPDKVRVVRTKDSYSAELCGGTHIDRTSTIGLFKIVSEGSIGSGVRRIEAVTGEKAKDLLMRQFDLISTIQTALKVNDTDIPAKIERLTDELNRLKAQLKKAVAGGGNISEQALASSKTHNGLRICVYLVGGENAPSTIRDLTDIALKKQVDISFLISEQNSKKYAILGVGERLIKKGITSKTIIEKLDSELGLRGGGKPHMAQIGFSKDVPNEKIEEEIKKLVDTVPQ